MNLIIKRASLRGASNVRVTSFEVREDTAPTVEVNFLVNLEPGKSLLDLAGVMMDLKKLLGSEAYVTEERSLEGDYRERVLKEAIPIRFNCRKNLV